ncbi:MAG: nicotinate phosphoribosyltransferase [Planctomycetales bacterium]|nr:nicotinate phosphoribosyltransferase [Planctomycetales bacterium]
MRSRHGVLGPKPGIDSIQESEREMETSGTSTDLYQLTMAQGYFRQGWADRRAVFHWTYRRAPFGGGGLLTCGLETLLELLECWRFSREDIAYLAGLHAADGSRLFHDDFLDWLGQQRWTGDLDAMPEGTWALPRTPLVRVTASLVQAQIVETMLLTVLNFQSLIATKAARIVKAADGDEVLEFGLRRAQGLDGGLSASRAAYIGGCHATSNVEAGRRYAIPVRGTHAHSWVMAFEDERDAFTRYSDSLSNNVVLLVDTYDTVVGVEHAIEIGLAMRARGERLLGIRLDSGDLAALSHQARAMLDAAGLDQVRIVASSDLDEYSIRRLKEQQAPIDVWGVGTRMVTAYDQPALGGVYKLGAIADDRGTLQPRLKRSDDPIKVSDPGAVGVSRVTTSEGWIGDVIHSADEPVGPEELAEIWPGLDASACLEPLLRPIMRGGRRVVARESMVEIRERAQRTMAQLDPLATAADSRVPEVTWTGSLSRLKAKLLSR